MERRLATAFATLAQVGSQRFFERSGTDDTPIWPGLRCRRTVQRGDFLKTGGSRFNQKVKNRHVEGIAYFTDWLIEGLVRLRSIWLRMLAVRSATQAQAQFLPALADAISNLLSGIFRF
ncbi:MAG: hypothetical protein Kow0031_09650 [Anaerolineae bacterium]